MNYMPVTISAADGPECHGVPQGAWMEAVYPFNLGTTSLGTCFALLVLKNDRSTLLAHVHAINQHNSNGFLADIAESLANARGIHIIFGASGFGQHTAATARSVVESNFPAKLQAAATACIESATTQHATTEQILHTQIEEGPREMFAVYRSNGSIVYDPAVSTVYLGGAAPTFLNPHQYKSNKTLMWNQNMTHLIAWDLPD